MFLIKAIRGGKKLAKFATQYVSMRQGYTDTTNYIIFPSSILRNFTALVTYLFDRSTWVISIIIIF